MEQLDKRGGGGGRPRFAAWTIPVAIIAIALVAALAVETLNDRIRERNEASILLVELEEEALHERVAAYEAINEGEVSPGVAGEFGEAREETAEVLDELKRLGPRKGTWGRSARRSPLSRRPWTRSSP